LVFILGDLRKTGTCDELKAHIKQYIQENKAELTKQPRFTALFSTRRRKALVPALALEGGLIQSSAHSHPSNPSPPPGYNNNFFSSQYNK